MKNGSFQISEHGNLLIYDRIYSAADVKLLIEANRLNGLRIFDFWDPLTSLDFLREFTFLRRLEIACRYDQEYSFLNDLAQLERFSVGPSLPMKNHIDLSALVNLQYLSIQWGTNHVSGLEACLNIEDLCLVEFPKSDLSLISQLTEVSRLRIKTGRLKSIHGIKNLKDLEELEIGNCRGLASISNLNGLENLKSVRIESCRKISDWDSLEDLPLLRSLKLINCGEIPNFHYRQRFPGLKLELMGRTKLKSPAED